jgi:hypothetical protein
MSIKKICGSLLHSTERNLLSKRIYHKTRLNEEVDYLFHLLINDFLLGNKISITSYNH